MSCENTRCCGQARTACVTSAECCDGLLCNAKTHACERCGPDGCPDAGTDASVDAAVDASVDAAVDASVDAAVDASVDAAVDASVDASVDAAVDAGSDADSAVCKPLTASCGGNGECCSNVCAGSVCALVPP